MSKNIIRHTSTLGRRVRPVRPHITVDAEFRVIDVHRQRLEIIGLLFARSLLLTAS